MNITIPGTLEILHIISLLAYDALTILRRCVFVDGKTISAELVIDA